MKPDSILIDNIQIIFFSILLLIRYNVPLIHIEDKKYFCKSTMYIKFKEKMFYEKNKKNYILNNAGGVHFYIDLSIKKLCHRLIYYF